jgi:hypothetical protein
LLLGALAALVACHSSSSSGGDDDGSSDADSDSDTDTQECYEGDEGDATYMPKYQQAIDLDSGYVYTCLDADCSTDPDTADEPWDFMFVDPGVHMLPHGDLGAEAAYLGTFATAPYHGVTDCDIEGADFTGDVVEPDLGGNAVLLVRTDEGAVFKIGYSGLEDYPDWDSAYGFEYSRLTQ